MISPQQLNNTFCLFVDWPNLFSNESQRCWLRNLFTFPFVIIFAFEIALPLAASFLCPSTPNHSVSSSWLWPGQVMFRWGLPMIMWDICCVVVVLVLGFNRVMNKKMVNGFYFHLLRLCWLKLGKSVIRAILAVLANTSTLTHMVTIHHEPARDRKCKVINTNYKIHRHIVCTN